MRKLLPALLVLLREPYSNRIQRRTAKSVGPLIFASLFLTLVIFLNIFVPTLAQNDKCADPTKLDLHAIQDCLDNLNRAREQSVVATAGVQKQIDGIRARVAFIENEVAVKQQQIDKSQEDLARIMDLLYATIRNYYMESQGSCPVCDLLLNASISDFVKIQAYEKTRIDRDKAFIINTAHSIQSLEASKKELEQERASLAGVKASLDKVVLDAKAYQADLSSQISQLSARQQSLLAERGSFSVSVGNAALTDDFNASLTGWQSNAPSGSATIFSFGAYAGNGSNYRRNGMSQYGALGRVKANPNISYEEILQAYYPGSQLVDYPVMGEIKVDGYENSLPFEDNYMKGIYEVPETWPMAVLKAQVIAARTYAVRVTNNGQGSICSSDKCQVYQPNLKTGDWATAVNDTKGKILVDGNGNPVNTQYVSTPGGYLDTKGWDTTCGNQSCLADGAYDRESPWFYKAWYTHYKYPTGFTSCIRNNPWLSQQDISDILNAWLVYNNGNDDDRNRILPPDGCGGGSPYSLEQMRDRADALGGAYSSISLNGIDQSTGGLTNEVRFNTNRGEVKITGFDTDCAHASGGCEDFWTIFNLRAPGNISIKNRMFDIRFK